MGHFYLSHLVLGFSYLLTFYLRNVPKKGSSFLEQNGPERMEPSICFSLHIIKRGCVCNFVTILSVHPHTHFGTCEEKSIIFHSFPTSDCVPHTGFKLVILFKNLKFQASNLSFYFFTYFFHLPTLR